MCNIHDSIKPIMSVIMMIVLLAQASAQATPPEPKIECLPLDGEYAGTESQTMYGDQCQKWSSQEPHQHELGVNDYEFPEMDVESASDYCRYIHPTSDMPWCFTTNPDVEWGYCDIPNCWTKEEICIANQTGLEYNGTVSQDIFNNTCLTWSDYDIDAESNYCRNTDADEEGPWCYIADQGDKIKQYCYIPLCEDVFLDYDEYGNTTYGNDTHDYNYTGNGYGDVNLDYDYGHDSGSWGDNGDDDDSGSWEDNGDDDDDSGSWEGDGDDGDDDDSGSWEGDGDDGDDDDSGSWKGDGDNGDDDDDSGSWEDNGDDDDGDDDSGSWEDNGGDDDGDDSGSQEDNGDGGDYYGGDYYG